MATALRRAFVHGRRAALPLARLAPRARLSGLSSAFAAAPRPAWDVPLADQAGEDGEASEAGHGEAAPGGAARVGEPRDVPLDGVADAGEPLGRVEPFSSTDGAGWIVAPATDVAATSMPAVAAGASALGAPEPVVPLFASAMSYPADSVLYMLHALHTSLDLPWWASIVGLTCAMRACLFPLNVDAMRVGGRLARAAPELAALQARLQAAVSAGQSEAELRALQMHMLGVYRTHGVSPFSALKLPLVQLPLFLSAIAALQRAGVAFPSMAAGGPPGFADLTAADPSYILPMLTSATMLFAVEAAMSSMPPAADEAGAMTQRVMRTALRCMSVASFPLMAHLPQGLLLYWVTNNTLTLAQTAILRVTAVRRALDLPEPVDPAALHAAAEQRAAAAAAAAAASGSGGGGADGAPLALPAWAAAGGAPVHAQALRLAEMAGALQRQGQHDGALALLRQAIRAAEGGAVAAAEGSAVAEHGGARASSNAHDGGEGAIGGNAHDGGGEGAISAPSVSSLDRHMEPPAGGALARSNAGGPAGGACAGAPARDEYGAHVRSLRVQLAQQLVRMRRWAEAEAEGARALAELEAAEFAHGGGAAGAPPPSLERVRALVALGDALDGQGEARRPEAGDAFRRALEAAAAPGGVGFSHELVIHALMRSNALATPGARG